MHDPVLISAHRFGAGDDRSAENSLPALERAIALGVDYVEFDVRRLDDGRFVVAHDAGDAHEGAPAYETVLDAIAGRVRAHIDLKFTSPGERYDAGRPYEVEATAIAVERLGDRLGDRGMIVTIGNDLAVRAVRDWGDAQGLDLLVGLSLGRSVRGLSFLRRIEVRRSELFPRLRVRESRANLLVAHWALALFGVAWFARRRNLPLLVWTVDPPDRLRFWLRPGRAWLVTTNHPARALELRPPTTAG